MKHMAMNVKTGEVLMCERGNHLKRAVKRTEQFNRTYWNAAGEWIFTHGRDCEAKMAAKWKSKKVL